MAIGKRRVGGLLRRRAGGDVGVDRCQQGPERVGVALDVATGSGLAAFIAAERVGREGTVIGLDASPAFLAVAEERAAAAGNDQIRWQEGDPARLSYADESFDAVLCLLALTDFPRPDERWRCGACGNLTRFDVARSRRTVEFWHVDLAGNVEVEDTEVRGEAIESVTCRWCGRSDAIEIVARNVSADAR